MTHLVQKMIQIIMDFRSLIVIYVSGVFFSLWFLSCSEFTEILECANLFLTTKLVTSLVIIFFKQIFCLSPLFLYFWDSSSVFSIFWYYLGPWCSFHIFLFSFLCALQLGYVISIIFLVSISQLRLLAFLLISKVFSFILWSIVIITTLYAVTMMLVFVDCFSH